VSLDAFAERIAAPGPPPAHALPLGLRFADSIGALLAGARTREGVAHARLDTARTGVAYLAAVMRLSELDDIDLRTCTTPSAVVVPVVLAAALRAPLAPEAIARGMHAGYHALARAGLAAGGIEAFTRGVWPTLAVAPLGAAATGAALRGYSGAQTATAMRLALLRAVGRAGATIPPLPGRWWLFGESVAAGVAAADAAAAGFLADPALDTLLGDLSADPFGAALADDDCGWISQKTFPTARQGANAAVAFADLLRGEALDPARIARIAVEVPPQQVRVISTPLDPANRLSAIANIGVQLGAVAFAPALLADCDREPPFPTAVLALAKRVTIVPSDELGAAFPRCWPARVIVELDDGKCFERTRFTIPGDPGEPLTLDDLAVTYAALDRAMLADAAAALTDADALERTLARVRA
jgi:2-methylcitrate dehydratase PrpD